MKKVLVIDSDEYNRLYLKILLSSAGYCPVVSKDGDEALSIFKDEEISLIMVYDQGIGIDVSELAEKIRGHRKDIPIILLSSYFEKPYDKKLFSERFLIPVDRNRLISIIEDLTKEDLN